MEPAAFSADKLKTDEGQRHAVFVCVGSVLQHAQHYELGLKAFIRILDRLQSGHDDPTEAEALVRSLQKQTLGKLLRQFTGRVKISDPSIPAILEQAVEKRNFFAHHFFLEREELLADEEGRLALLRELLDLGELFEKSGSLMRAMGTVIEDTLDGRRRESDAPVVFTMEIDET